MAATLISLEMNRQDEIMSEPYPYPCIAREFRGMNERKSQDARGSERLVVSTRGDQIDGYEDTAAGA